MRMLSPLVTVIALRTRTWLLEPVTPDETYVDAVRKTAGSPSSQTWAWENCKVGAVNLSLKGKRETYGAHVSSKGILITLLSGLCY